MWHSGALSATVSAKRPGGCVFCARFNAGLWNMLYRASPRTLGAYFTWLALFILQRARNDLKNVLGLVRRLFSRYLYFLPKVSGLRLKLGATTAFTDELCSYRWFWTRELLVSTLKSRGSGRYESFGKCPTRAEKWHISPPLKNALFFAVKVIFHSRMFLQLPFAFVQKNEGARIVRPLVK